MKKCISNILSFLLVSATLSLVSFSQSFTYENSIVLPTTSHDDDNLVLPAVLDRDGDPLKIGERYIIENPLIGGGAVYLDNIGHLKCPNAVLQHVPTPQFSGIGTPVLFVHKSDDADVVREMSAIYIMFVDRAPLCVNETVWKVDEKQFVVTGGTIGNESDLFKIMKTDDWVIKDLKNIYKLMHCPSQLGCKDIGRNFENEYPNLVTVEKNYIPFVFIKANYA
ncbi:hypothetical protein H5410_017567 [Solanum commersonii]|uniref:Kunitz-type tuber invertase inhibitor n=1 Tax=Solanum commersonii TaxID=4109 RepID=A0A9J6A0V1_SOLCO|nr:hypothetical protein H5410_017567 [Solanum commersonii]